GKGNGTSLPVTQSAGPASPQSTAVADWNGDGKPDLVEGLDKTPSLVFARGNGDGTFMLGASVALPAVPWTLQRGDLDGDGKLDVLVVSLGSIAVTRGNGDGTFQAPVQTVTDTDTSLYRFTASLGDFTGDGKPDVAWTARNPA